MLHEASELNLDEVSSKDMWNLDCNSSSVKSTPTDSTPSNVDDSHIVDKESLNTSGEKRSFDSMSDSQDEVPDSLPPTKRHSAEFSAPVNSSPAVDETVKDKPVQKPLKFRRRNAAIYTDDE